MKRFRTIGLTLVAVFAFSAVAASAAQAVTAPFFTIGGTRLISGKTHNFDARALPSGTGFTLSTPAAGVSITCTALQVENGVLLGSNAGQPGKDNEIDKFTGCTTTGNGTTCKVIEPITTNPLTSELVEIDRTKQVLGEEFKPTTGVTFVTLKFTNECTALKEAKVTGEVASENLTDSTAQGNIELGQTPTEATSWLVSFPTTPITTVLLVNTSGTKESVELEPLEVATFKSTLVGIALTLLANTKFEPERTALWSPLP